MSKSISLNASDSRAHRQVPDKAPAWAAVMAVASMAFLAFVAGAAIMHFGVFPMDPLRRAFSGGAALYEGMTAYNDRTQTDFWADARTEKRGVTRYDPARAANGLTLYSSAHEQSAYLMDMQGKVVHRWHLNFSALWDDSAAVKQPRGDDFIHIEKAQVLPNGDLIALYTAIGDTPWGYGIAKLNAQSQVIWKYLGQAHHDFAVDDAGNVHVLTQQVEETDLPGFAHLPKPRIDDFLVTLSPDGTGAHIDPADGCVRRIALRPPPLFLLAGILHQRRLPARQLGRHPERPGARHAGQPRRPSADLVPGDQHGRRWSIRRAGRWCGRRAAPGCASTTRRCCRRHPAAVRQRGQRAGQAPRACSSSTPPPRASCGAMPAGTASRWRASRAPARPALPTATP